MNYNNFILTMIAVLLGLNLLMPIIRADEATAQNGVMDVNIVEVSGSHISPYAGFKKGIPVVVIN